MANCLLAAHEVERVPASIQEQVEAAAVRVPVVQLLSASRYADAQNGSHPTRAQVASDSCDAGRQTLMPPSSSPKRLRE